MNLKESFRYQNFLDSLMNSASRSLSSREHAAKVKKTHKREDGDIVEYVEPLVSFYPNEDVIRFWLFLIDEKQKLGEKISDAKRWRSLDIDAAVSANKYRQSLHQALVFMMDSKPKKYVEKGCGYRINNDGNQTEYYYDVEVEVADNFDRAKAKEIAKAVAKEADKVSAEIDSILVNTDVEYEPVLDVNDSFDDCMEKFLNLNQ